MQSSPGSGGTPSARLHRPATRSGRPPHGLPHPALAVSAEAAAARHAAHRRPASAVKPRLRCRPHNVKARLFTGLVPANRWQAWAPDAAYRNGTYYLVFCALETATGMFRTGLAISDRPEGPFTDIGFIDGVEWGQDPALYIDDDDEAYLYWGIGGNAKAARYAP